jgi:hypothetical protein
MDVDLHEAQLTARSLIETALAEARSIRLSAVQRKHVSERKATLRLAQIIEELVRYAQDRDRALTAAVEKNARLMAMLEYAARSG